MSHLMFFGYQSQKLPKSLEFWSAFLFGIKTGGGSSRDDLHFWTESEVRRLCLWAGVGCTKTGDMFMPISSWKATPRWLCGRGLPWPKGSSIRSPNILRSENLWFRPTLRKQRAKCLCSPIRWIIERGLEAKEDSVPFEGIMFLTTTPRIPRARTTRWQEAPQQNTSCQFIQRIYYCPREACMP